MHRWNQKRRRKSSFGQKCSKKNSVQGEERKVVLCLNSPSLLPQPPLCLIVFVSSLVLFSEVWKLQSSAQLTVHLRKMEGKKAVKKRERGGQKRKKKHTTPREKMSNPYLFCQGQMAGKCGGVTRKKERKKDKEKHNKTRRRRKNSEM